MKLKQLVLIVEHGRLLVAGLGRGLKGWRVVRSETVALGDLDSLAENLLAALKPVAVTWGLAPGTPAMLVLPPGIGGLLSLRVPKQAAKNLDAAMEAELSKLLPYPVREVSRGVSSRISGDQCALTVLWFPRALTNELNMALSRLGVRLAEIFQRAQLFAPAANKDNATVAMVEKVEGNVYCHFFHADGQPWRSRLLTVPGSEDWLQEMGMELLAVESGGVRLGVVEVRGLHPDVVRGRFPELVCRSATDSIGLPERLIALQDAGGEGVWFPPPADQAMKQLVPLILGVAALGMAAVGYYWWSNGQLTEQLSKLETERDHIEPKYKEAADLENQAVALVGKVRAIEALEKEGGSPLDPLYEVYKVLPDQAWLTRYAFRPEGVEVEGYGLTTKELNELLKDNRRFGDPKDLPPQIAVDEARKPFASSYRWTREP